MDRAINENAILKNIDTTPFVAFPMFEAYPELLCGFSTRLGGVSRGCFASMNLGFCRGDEEERVFENYRRICTSMGTAPGQLIFTDQVHKTNVRRAYKKDCGKGIFFERDYSEIDGHVTNEPGAVLLVFGADCVPVFFYDPVKHAIGAAHAGWKGTAGGIARVMVERMFEEFTSEPSDLRVVIGPSIGQECYEVSADVADVFFGIFGEEAGHILMPPKKAGSGNKEEKYFLDLWEANRKMLLSAGVKAEHIAVSGLCSMCRQDLFFSHRASGGKRGSMAGFMMLREKEKR